MSRATRKPVRASAALTGIDPVAIIALRGIALEADLSAALGAARVSGYRRGAPVPEGGGRSPRGVPRDPRRSDGRKGPAVRPGLLDDGVEGYSRVTGITVPPSQRVRVFMSSVKWVIQFCGLGFVAETGAAGEPAVSPSVDWVTERVK